MDRFRTWLKATSLAVLALGAACQSAPHSPSDGADFDAAEAWSDFESGFRLFYAYLDRPDFDANTVLARAETEALQSGSANEFAEVLNTLLYAWTDPHLVITPIPQEAPNIIPTSSDLRLARRGGVFIIEDLRAGSAADQAGIRPGWVLTHVDGEPIETQIDEVYGGLIDNLTATQIDYAANLIANGKRGQSRALRFETQAGEPIDFSLPTPQAYARDLLDAPLVTTSRHGEIGRIRINNSLGNNGTVFAFDAAMEDLSDTSGLIIDLRNTPSGGNTEVGRSILGHFVTSTESYQVHEIPSLEREFSVPRRFIEQVLPRDPLYSSDRVVVLGGPWTGSMGEGLVIGFDAATNATVMASDMGDLLGGLFTLYIEAADLTVDLGREALFHVDGTPREDFVAPVTLASSDRDADGNDPGLEMALAHLKKAGGD